VTPIAAGVLGVPFAQFLPAVALGAFLYILALVPLAATLLLALLAARGLLPLATRGGGYLVAVEVVRWGAFGVALGELLPLDGRLHQAEPAGPGRD